MNKKRAGSVLLFSLLTLVVSNSVKAMRPALGHFARDDDHDDYRDDGEELQNYNTWKGERPRIDTVDHEGRQLNKSSWLLSGIPSLPNRRTLYVVAVALVVGGVAGGIFYLLKKKQKKSTKENAQKSKKQGKRKRKKKNKKPRKRKPQDSLK